MILWCLCHISATLMLNTAFKAADKETETIQVKYSSMIELHNEEGDANATFKKTDDGWEVDVEFSIEILLGHLR